MLTSTISNAQSCPPDSIPEHLDGGLIMLSDNVFQLPNCDQIPMVLEAKTLEYSIQNPNYDPGADLLDWSYAFQDVFYVFVIPANYEFSQARLITEVEELMIEWDYEDIMVDVEIVEEFLNVDNYENANSPSIEWNIYAVHLSLGIGVLDQDECYMVPSISMALDMITNSYESSSGNFNTHLHIGHLADPEDEQLYTLSNFLNMFYAGGSDDGPYVIGKSVVLADGTTTPVNLSDIVFDDPNPAQSDPDKLPHPDVACRLVSGEGEGRALHVKGVLNIDEDYCFSNPYAPSHIDPIPLPDYLDVLDIPLYTYIYLDEGAQIVVEEGVTFNLHKTIVLGCHTLWDHIVVRDSGTLNISESYIKDGVHAIRAEEGATVNLTNNIFDANHISLFTPPNSGHGRYEVDFGPFYGNYFFNFSDMKDYPSSYTDPQYNQPYKAIELNDLQIFVASGIGPLGQVDLNTIDGMMYGIHAKNSGLMLQNYRILDTEPHSEYPKSGIAIWLEQNGSIASVIQGDGKEGTQTEISNARVGVMMSGGFSTVDGNRIERVETGVHVREYSSFNVQGVVENYIDASLYGINFPGLRTGIVGALENEIHIDQESSNRNFASGINFRGYGLNLGFPPRIEGNEVRVYNNSKYAIVGQAIPSLKVRNNTVIAMEATTGYTGISLKEAPRALVDFNQSRTSVGSDYPSLGLLMENSPTNRFNCNNTNDTRYGMNVVGSSDGSEIKGNFIQIHNGAGLLYGTLFSQQSINITGEQVHHGNIWDDWYETSAPSGIFGAVHLDGLFNALESKFTIDENLMSGQFTTSRTPSLWFDHDTDFGGITWGCPEEMPEEWDYDLSPSGSPTKLDEDIARNDPFIPGAKFSGSLTYISKRNLYDRIQNGYYHPAALTRTALDTFLSDMQSSSISELYTIRRDLAEGVQLSETEIDYLENKLDSVNLLAISLITLDSLAWIDTNSVDTTQWLTDRSELLNVIYTLNNSADGYYQNEAPNPSATSASVQSDLGEMSPTLAPEAFEIEMLDLIAATVYLDDWDFSSQQEGLIEEISEYCPAYGGAAVYWARNLRNSYEPEVTYADSTCSESWSPRYHRPLEEEASPVSLYPNPVQTSMNVELNGGEYQSWQIFGTDGRMLRSGSIPEDEQQLQLEVNLLEAGQYFLILKGPEETQSISFIIQRP